jgi:hypothetical protein
MVRVSPSADINLIPIRSDRSPGLENWMPIAPQFEVKLARRNTLPSPGLNVVADSARIRPTAAARDHGCTRRGSQDGLDWALPGRVSNVPRGLAITSKPPSIRFRKGHSANYARLSCATSGVQKRHAQTCGCRLKPLHDNPSVLPMDRVAARLRHRGLHPFAD